LRGAVVKGRTVQKPIFVVLAQRLGGTESESVRAGEQREEEEVADIEPEKANKAEEAS
jgi:hypothetical protein